MGNLSMIQFFLCYCMILWTIRRFMEHNYNSSSFSFFGCNYNFVHDLGLNSLGRRRFKGTFGNCRSERQSGTDVIFQRIWRQHLFTDRLLSCYSFNYLTNTQNKVNCITIISVGSCSEKFIILSK